MGRGTSINSQVYMRGRPQDYNEWQNILRVNNNYIGWSWQDVLPYFKEMENNSNIKNEYHGKAGPLKVSNSSYVNKLPNDFEKTVHDLGIPLTNDFNGKEQKEVGLYHLCITFLLKRG